MATMASGPPESFPGHLETDEHQGPESFHPDDGWCKVPLTSLPADENGYSICTSKDASKSASADKAVDCGPWIRRPDEILLYN